MQNDKRPLSLDLSFLDEKSRLEAPPPVDSGYKFNWKNLTIFAVIALVIGSIIVANNNSSPTSTSPTSPTSPTSTTWSPQAPTTSTRQSSTYSEDGVTIGRYRCSRSASNQADRLRPTNSAAIEAEEQQLQRRSSTLANLRRRIEASNVSQYSTQSAIDQYNGMIDEYNALLSPYQNDSRDFQAKLSYFNTQVDAYNSYLNTNCTKR